MSESASAIPVIESVAELATNCDAWLCDIWGVIHNGVSPFPGAVEACRRFRETGGTVVLISNSPRPRGAVMEQLQSIGVPREAWDAVVTSGDVTRRLIERNEAERVFHLGPERDEPIFDGLDVTLRSEAEADVVVCSGLYDDARETPGDYAKVLARLKERGLPMICANPDRMVERGDRLIYCAGALAAEYERLGGRVIYAGKPYPPIYELALQRIAKARGEAVAPGRILCIGDGVQTDMAGAEAAGLKALFVASGLHMTRTRDGETLDERELALLFAGESARPVAAQKRLSW